MNVKFYLPLVLALFTGASSFAQVTFGVSPGIGFNSAYLGYKINEKIIPFVGFQFAHIKYNIEVTGEEFDYDLYQVVSYSNTG